MIRMCASLCFLRPQGKISRWFVLGYEARNVLETGGEYMESEVRKEMGRGRGAAVRNQCRSPRFYWRISKVYHPQDNNVYGAANAPEVISGRNLTSVLKSTQGLNQLCE